MVGGWPGVTYCHIGGEVSQGRYDDLESHTLIEEKYGLEPHILSQGGARPLPHKIGQKGITYICEWPLMVKITVVADNKQNYVLKAAWNEVLTPFIKSTADG